MKFLVFCFSLLLAAPAFAGVDYDPATKSLEITGPTSSYQAIMVNRAVANHEIDTIYMNGPGGEFYAGLAIGRKIAETGARVIIPSGSECISACALAAMAAEEIHVDGRVLLHRVFTMGVPSLVTVEEIGAHFGAVYIELASYMQEVGYPLSFTLQMVRNTSPCKFMVVDDESDLERAKQNGSLAGYDVDDRCGG